MRTTRVAVIAGFVLALAVPALSQGTVADYQRAMGLRDKYQGLALNVPEPATWVEKTPRFWYRKSVKAAMNSCSSRPRPRSGAPPSTTRSWPQR
jgi:hypothetical protein